MKKNRGHQEEKSEWKSKHVIDLKQIVRQKQEQDIHETYAQKKEEQSKKVADYFQQPKKFVHISPNSHKKQTPSQSVVKQSLVVVENLRVSGGSNKPDTKIIDAPAKRKKSIWGDAKTELARFWRVCRSASSKRYHPAVSKLKWRYRRYVAAKAAAHVSVVLLVVIIPVLSVPVFSILSSRVTHIESKIDDIVSTAQDIKSQITRVDLQSSFSQVNSLQQKIQEMEQLIQASLPDSVVDVIGMVPVVGDSYVSARSLVLSSEKTTQAAQEMMVAFQKFDQSNAALTTRIDAMTEDMLQAHTLIQGALADAQKVRMNAIPEEYRDSVSQYIGLLFDVERGISFYLDSRDVLLSLLGQDRFQRYLVIFENDNELRATGGFMGSFALVDIDQGKIKNIDVPAGGTYDMKGGLTTRLQSPPELGLVNPQWQFQDSNWFYDYPESAKKISWFYEKSGGPTVDGVLVMTSGAVAELLKILGPIPFDGDEKQLTAENFETVLQRSIELQKSGDPKPKQIITDLVPMITQRVFETKKEDMSTLVAALLKSFEKKQLMLYAQHPQAQEIITRLGWSGEIPAYSKDYLAIVHSNIGGGKTDGVMKNDIHVMTTITEEGKIRQSVTLKRTHEGDKQDVFTGIKNVDFVRFYVPKGSTLIQASGFEQPGAGLFLKSEDILPVDEDYQRLEGTFKVDAASGTKIVESDKNTVFGNWVLTDVGETKEMTLVYELPFSFVFHDVDNLHQGSYQIVLGKQAGDDQSSYTMDWIYPKKWNLIWQYPEQKTFILSHDTMLGFVVEQ